MPAEGDGVIGLPLESFDDKPDFREVGILSPSERALLDEELRRAGTTFEEAITTRSFIDAVTHATPRKLHEIEELQQALQADEDVKSLPTPDTLRAGWRQEEAEKDRIQYRQRTHDDLVQRAASLRNLAERVTSERSMKPQVVRNAQREVLLRRAVRLERQARKIASDG